VVRDVVLPVLVPLGLFGVAFSLAVFPSFSLLVAEKKEKEIIKNS